MNGRLPLGLGAQLDERLHLAEELVQSLGRDPGITGRLEISADARNHVVDQLADFLVVPCRCARHDAIAVERHLREALACFGRIRDADLRCVRLAEEREDVASRSERRGAGLVGVVYRFERQRVARLHEIVGGLEPRGGPLHRLDQLPRAHATVAIGIDQLERALIEVKP